MYDENGMTTKRKHPSPVVRRVAYKMKWLYGQRNLNVGDIVIVMGSDTLDTVKSPVSSKFHRTALRCPIRDCKLRSAT